MQIILKAEQEKKKLTLCMKNTLRFISLLYSPTHMHLHKHCPLDFNHFHHLSRVMICVRAAHSSFRQFEIDCLLKMCFRPEEASKSSATSVLLGICPEEPREPLQPYTSMHTKHNHTNESLPHLNKQETRIPPLISVCHKKEPL